MGQHALGMLFALFSVVVLAVAVYLDKKYPKG